MRDPYGLVPPHIKANYEAEEMVDRQIAQASTLLRALKNHDSQIRDIVFIKGGAPEGGGIKPGRWHVVRANTPPAPDSYFAIETPDGGFREPDSGVYEELLARDLHNRDVWDRLQEKNRGNKPAALREYEHEDEGEAEEIAHDVRAAARVAGDGGMHARKWGRS